MSAIQEYLDSLQEKTITVIGMGVSNTPLIWMLLRAGLKVTVRDKAPRERSEELAGELESLGAQLILGGDYLEDLHEDLIFRTPGLSPNTPQVKAAVEQGSELTSEMELFFRTCPCQIIAVTGSDGKTTSTTIITEFLKAAGYNVYVGGNIGKPLLPDVGDMEPDDMAVLELSSFQLMTMDQSPNISVFTNLAPNHLDYHHTMEEYTAAKTNIFRHQGEGDRVIFNLDCERLHPLAEMAPAGVVWFSRQERPEQGVYLRDGAIWLSNTQGSREVLPLDRIKIPGVHNIENYMAAIAAVDGLVPDQVVREVADKFQGVEHRIEKVRELDGVTYYNDSIGTSPSRTAACLHAFAEAPGDMILIAGGYDKQIPFTTLALDIVERVQILVLNGATAQAIRKAVEQAETYKPGHPEIIMIDGFDQAVEEARKRAKSGDYVVLSPACAAFDQFKNFVERGKHFKELVQNF